MSLRLILLRHAKSDWTDAALDDADRPLNARGRRDAPRVGRWLAGNDLMPDRAYCSPARRAQETLEDLGLEISSTTVPNLYMASPRALLATIRGAVDPTILVVAHNPGIGALAHELVAKAPDHPRWHDYPTAATLVAEFDVRDWTDIQPGTAEVRAFVTPHDLPA